MERQEGGFPLLLEHSKEEALSGPEASSEARVDQEESKHFPGLKMAKDLSKTRWCGLGTRSSFCKVLVMQAIEIGVSSPEPT